jgi:hypothetical protein
MDATKRCPFCAEEILSAAIRCKHCKSDLSARTETEREASPGPKAIWIGRILGIVGLTIFGIWLLRRAPPPSIFAAPPSSLQPEPGRGADVPAIQPSVPASLPVRATEPPAPAIALPSAEAQLIEIVSRAQRESESAANDMQKGGVKNRRDKALCSLMRERQVNNWFGKIKAIGANSDGKGTIEIEIADNIILKTWNNELSDATSGTLIDPNTALFKTASSLQGDQAVRFSGKFLPSDNEGECIDEGSITLSGKLREPEFIFRFSAIQGAP